MTFVSILKQATLGAAGGVALITALPIFGAVGAITATGAAVGATMGAVLGVCDAIRDEENSV
ncbi:hypothetical protein [Chitinilyticum piscinae]|uniref:Uncharacterized protein n=1 Tax=Chitinilyticum piscinae TaxID=2866724 RepID=A0A8J7FKB9_9NEIS|nr:hypothetical protein [Chitinilyticum piscinae]MBE9610818.1 hypothetical protein [Chitinilyticum piscinae]